MEWRVRLFGVGAILALFGIGADIEPLRWAALVVLAVAAVLGFVAARSGRRTGEEAEEEELRI